MFLNIFTWLGANIGNIVVLLLVGLLIFVCVHWLYKSHKKGEKCAGCNGSNCGQDCTLAHYIKKAHKKHVQEHAQEHKHNI